MTGMRKSNKWSEWQFWPSVGIRLAVQYRLDNHLPTFSQLFWGKIDFWSYFQCWANIGIRSATQHYLASHFANHFRWLVGLSKLGQHWQSAANIGHHCQHWPNGGLLSAMSCDVGSQPQPLTRFSFPNLMQTWLNETRIQNRLPLERGLVRRHQYAWVVMTSIWPRYIVIFL